MMFFLVLWWCGDVFVVVLWCFCGGVRCGEVLWSSVVEKCCEGVMW